MLLIVVVFIVAELATGKTFDNAGSFDRKERPIAYWIILGIHMTVLVLLIYVGFFFED